MSSWQLEALLWCTVLASGVMVLAHWFHPATFALGTIALMFTVATGTLLYSTNQRK